MNKRLDSIDVLRALAILGMIQVHFTENLSVYMDGESLLYTVSAVLGFLPAPFFTFLAGMSLFLSLDRQRRAGFAEEQIFRRNARRGTAVFFLGLLFAVFIWRPEEVFNWDILPLLGSSMLLLFSLRRLSPRLLLGIAGLVILVSPPLRIWSDYSKHWNSWGEYVYSFSFSDVLFGFFANGYFPLFPWFAFPLAGFAAGKICFSGNEGTPDTGSSSGPRILLRTGIILLSAGLLLGLGSRFYAGESRLLSGYLSGFSFYPASTAFMILLLGLVFTSFSLLHLGIDNKKDRRGPVMAFFRRYSRFSFSTYVAHHIVHIWPLLIASGIEGRKDPWYYYGEVISTAGALVLFVLFTLLFYLFLVYWERRGAKYGFEWILGVLTE